MPLEFDDVLGVTYLDVFDFVDRAAMFGVNVALPDNDDLTAAYLAAASRYIDARCHRAFDPDTEYTEQHNWDPTTRRIYPGNAPVSSISSYRIYVGASTYSIIPTNALFINNNGGYVEVTSLATAGSLISQLLLIGLYEPIVQITYKSLTDVKPNIALATGYIAATMMNQSYLSSSLPTGVKSIRVGSQAQVTLGDISYDISKGSNLVVPSIVDTLLTNEIAIGVA